MSQISTDLFSVTELADERGIPPRAIRFYETKGLIKPRRAGTTRVYTHRDRGRMQLILRGKRLGFSLADIKEYLDLYDVDPSQVSQLRLLMDKINDRVSELEQQREDLETTLMELEEMRQECLSHIEMRRELESKQG